MRVLKFLFLVILLSSVNLGYTQSALRIALQHYEAGRYDQSIAAASVAIGEGTEAEAYYCRANAHHKLGHFSEALEDYDRARINGFSDEQIYLHRGICKISLMMYEPARMDLMQHLEFKPDDAQTYYWMAALEYMSMENKASLRYLEEALALDSTYADAYYLRAANMAEMKRSNLALQDFQLALYYNPKLLRAKFHMAVLLIGMGQFENAIELLSELQLENADFISEVLYYRGEALYYMHDLEGACTDWKESAQLGDRDAQHNLKKVCGEKGKLKNKTKTYFEF
jgi:tetratricopeptide (TPR) repeat protein